MREREKSARRERRETGELDARRRKRDRQKRNIIANTARPAQEDLPGVSAQVVHGGEHVPSWQERDLRLRHTHEGKDGRAGLFHDVSGCAQAPLILVDVEGALPLERKLALARVVDELVDAEEPKHSLDGIQGPVRNSREEEAPHLLSMLSPVVSSILAHVLGNGLRGRTKKNAVA